MTRPGELSPQVLAAIARQLGTFSQPFGIALASEDKPELGESFQVWLEPANAILSPAPLDAATPTSKWHHQVYRNGRPEAIAYSQPFGPRPEDWEVTGAFQGSIAQDVDRAVDAADALGLDDRVARLLTVPAYQIQALWLVGTPNLIVPAVVPEAFQNGVRPYVGIPSGEFFEKLRDLRHIQGIVL